MGFLSNIANRTPIVGHLKGVYHYVCNENEKGDEAMYQSTRTSAVMAGGIAGGPAGAVAAGLATDCVVSVVTREEKGIVKSSKDIGYDLALKKNPSRSLLSLGLQVGVDAMCGSGGPYKGASGVFKKTATSTAHEVIEETVIAASTKVTTDLLFTQRIVRTSTSTNVARSITEIKIALEECERRDRESKKRERERQQFAKQEECKKKEQQANSEKQKRDTSGSSSGSSQPPQGNKDNNRKHEGKNEPSFFEIFMVLLRRILINVYGNESEPFSTMFENLPKGRKDYLIKVLKPISRFGTLDVVIELVIRMFKQHFTRDISFENFLSLLEFVQTYISDELLERTRISSGTRTAKTMMEPNEHQAKIISEIASEKDIIHKLISLFEGLKTKIEAETATWNYSVFPNFRDIFAAVYHYFKHRRVPADGRILSIKEYYDWIRKFLPEIKTTKKYTELKNSKLKNYVHETFVPIFHRRFKIVLKNYNNKIVLSSACVVDKMNQDDEKHIVSTVVQSLAVVFMAIGFFYILKGVFSVAALILLNAPSIVFTCITFTVNLLLNVLLLFFACFIFILKILFNILLIFILTQILFFFYF